MAVCCRNPVSITLGGAALALAVGILVDWRRTLQYIGTGGLLFTALARTTSYSKPQVRGHAFDSCGQLCTTCHGRRLESGVIPIACAFPGAGPSGRCVLRGQHAGGTPGCHRRHHEGPRKQGYEAACMQAPVTRRSLDSFKCSASSWTLRCCSAHAVSGARSDVWRQRPR
jgi:hypothetical protein